MALFIKSLESLFVPSQVEPNRYVAGTFGENPYAAAEIYMNEILQENHDNNVEILNYIWENETELHELAEARKVQGIWKAVGGGVLIVVGGACIFFSGGAATPIVIGAGTMLFGAADVAEGGQDIYHGSTGDLDTSSFNYIRDTVFQGNQKVYDIVEEVFSFAAGASIPICKAYKAGELTLRSGGVILGEEILAEGAGFGGSYLAGKYTDNPTLQLLAGVGASMLVGGAGTMLDKRFNLSGNFPKVPDAPDINPNQVKPDLDLDIDGTPGRNPDVLGINPDNTKTNVELDSKTVETNGNKKTDVSEIDVNVGGKNFDDISGISNKALKHPINKHMPSNYANQLKFRNRADVEKQLKNTSFFNAEWTENQVKEAMNYGFKEATAKGITDGAYTFNYLGESVVVCLEDGIFKTGYGTHKYTYEQLMALLP